MTSSGEGMQVLFVEDSGRYRCDEALLRRVCSSNAAPAQSLPVVVVSVAGATRGGKSFLLDFFLRYLRAPEASRLNGTWLGADHDPLTGFSWRGGCERHTQGILVWSEPIVVDLGPEKDNQKVALVLLDTQGSFDTRSTLRDSCTVFALSTLLSSVQLYNLSQNIQEDDLHYLQLFSEYGKLAHEEGTDKPFQELWFLVRDWCFAYDHPFGAEGGQQLLDKRLEIREDQASELREIRAHMRGAFERVRGFLMPHPGLTVACDPNFNGCLKDITGEFKTALLELVPSLFAPENLKIKHINGQPLLLEDFTEYFKTYVEIFNSDTLPTPTTVMEATSAASIEVALNACRTAYNVSVEQQARGAACVPRNIVQEHHAAALLAARQAFAARRLLGSSSAAAARLDALLLELDASLPDLEARNSGRILAVVSRCKTGYEANMFTVQCLTDEELTEQHNSALTEAKREFLEQFLPDENLRDIEHRVGDENLDSSQDEEESREDVDNEDWEFLKQELEMLLPLHRERNAVRMDEAYTLALDLYTERMRAALEGTPCVPQSAIRSTNRTARADAITAYCEAWLNGHTVPESRIHHLTTGINEKCEEFSATNDENNIKEIGGAVDVYKNIMSEICNGEGGKCLHPQDLYQRHQNAMESASRYFRERRDPAGMHTTHDIHESNLLKDISQCHREFKESNENRNKAAVRAAHEFYVQTMTPNEVPVAMVGTMDMNVTFRHPRVKEMAINQFMSKRRVMGFNYAQDTYLDDLKKKIDNSYNNMLVKLALSIGSTVVGLFALGSMMGLRR